MHVVHNAQSTMYYYLKSHVVMVLVKNTADEDLRYKNLALSSNQKNIRWVGSKLITAASK